MKNNNANLDKFLVLYDKKYIKYSEDKLRTLFPNLMLEFIIPGLSLGDSRKYYKNEVFRFYIDNIDSIKEDNKIFLNFISSLSANTRKSLTAITIKATYPIVYESWLLAKNKKYDKDYSIEELCHLLVSGNIPKKYDEKYLVNTLNNDTITEEYDNGIKLSLLVRKYIFLEDINVRCKSCNSIVKYGTNECNSCYLDKKKERAKEKRKIEILERSTNFDIIIENFYDENFYNAEFLVQCNRCLNKLSYVFKSSKREFKCVFCDSKEQKNKIEKDISLLIEESIINTRSIIKPLELDIYSAKHKFAIEYNGLIWHSFGMSKHSKFNNYLEEDKNNHLKKTILCSELNIMLYNIFENEWLNPVKKDIWISKIEGKQGLHERIFARKCTIKEVQSKEARIFLEENHLQGYSNSKLKIGLYYKEELISIGTFGKPRFTNKYEYELIRMCTKKNVTVVGGAGKILKYFEKTFNPKSLVSYANRRWSTGNVYEKLGFDFSHITEPNYFYFKDKNILYSRNKFQKHKLKEQLEIFNNELSESENMYINGYRKIYDCGNLVYVKRYN